MLFFHSENCDSDQWKGSIGERKPFRFRMKVFSRLQVAHVLRESLDSVLYTIWQFALGENGRTEQGQEKTALVSRKIHHRSWRVWYITRNVKTPFLRGSDSTVLRRWISTRGPHAVFHHEKPILPTGRFLWFQNMLHQQRGGWGEERASLFQQEPLQKFFWAVSLRMKMCRSIPEASVLRRRTRSTSARILFLSWNLSVEIVCGSPRRDIFVRGRHFRF